MALSWPHSCLIFGPNRAFQVNYIIITCFSSLLSLLLLIITSVIILLLLIITSVITSLLPIIITRSIIGNNGSIISYHRPGQLGDEFGQIGLRLCACPLYMWVIFAVKYQSSWGIVLWLGVICFAGSCAVLSERSDAAIWLKIGQCTVRAKQRIYMYVFWSLGQFEHFCTQQKTPFLKQYNSKSVRI